MMIKYKNIRRCKIINYILLSIILMFIVFYLFERSEYRTAIFDLSSENSRLSRLEYYREGKDLRFYGLPKDSIMKILPKPEYDYIIKLDSSKVNPLDWMQRYFVITYLKSRYDTVEVNIIKWRIPYHEIPNLYLGFIKRDGIWVVDDGVQWDDTTKVD